MKNRILHSGDHIILNLINSPTFRLINSIEMITRVRSSMLYITEACLFGDQLGEITNGKDCSGLVAADPSNCYRNMFRSPCCASCASAYTNITGK